MGITVIPRLAQEISIQAFSSARAGDQQLKVSDVSGVGQYYRHPDSALVSYANITDNEEPMGRLPEGRDYSIAIVGGGASGIASLYELSKVARAMTSGHRINVTIYEPDPNHFSHCSQLNGTGCCSLPMNSKVDTKCKRAGRVFAARSRDSTGDKDHSVYEIGAMRFPEIAGLTWKYAQAVFGPDANIDQFPNPGTVPTEFVFGDRVDRYKNGFWLDSESPTKLISNWVSSGVQGTTEPTENISMFKIGGKDPAKISQELKDVNTKPERLKDIQLEWREFVEQYDGVTLEWAVRTILRAKLKEMKESKRDCLLKIEGLDNDSDKLNYCVQLFGCFGFGTGGFKSIFNMALPEMMRLILWSYNNEYTLPVKENVEFISGLFSRAQGEKNLQVNVVRGRVCDVCHSGDGLSTPNKALILYYESSGGKEDNHLLKSEHDYVILSVPPHQLSSMCSRAGFSGKARQIRFGDYGRQSDAQLLARPALLLSKQHECVNVNLFTAINQLNLVGSSKIFGTIKAQVFDRYARQFQGEQIKAIVSDCGLASSYVVPSPLEDKQRPEYYSFLISYAWEDDTKKLQHKLKSYPISHMGKAKPENHINMVRSIINHTVRDVKDPDANFDYKRWWFGQVLAKDDNERHLTETLSYDWNTSHASGAFKLDTTGGHYNSHMCFRYHTHALDGQLDNRFFLAGCSYGHLGGWLEGAFMSSMNAVAGLIVAANGGGERGVRALVEKARPIMESLEPLVPIRAR